MGYAFQVNDIVRSRYRTPWVGVVIDRTKRRDANPLYEVRVVLDSTGRPVSKHERSLTRRIDEAWLVPHTPRDAEQEALIRLWADQTTGWSALPSPARVASRYLSGREWKPDQVAMRYRDTRKRVTRLDEDWGGEPDWPDEVKPPNRYILKQMQEQWWWLKNDADYIVDWILETRAIPTGKAKQVELLARAFKSYARAPSNVHGWWNKNRPLLDLLFEAEHWPEKQEVGEGGIEEVFAVGPFKVHNTLHLSGEDLAGTKTVIEEAVSALKGAGAKLSKVLYGDIRVVGQLQKSHTLAWYISNVDEVYLRPHLKVGRGEVHNLIHELGHRFWHREMAQTQHFDWKLEFRGIEAGKVTLPKEGDEVPVKAPRGTKGPVTVVKDEGYRYVLSTGGSLDKMRLVQFLREKSREEAFPTPYAATSDTEYFAEAFAMYVLGTLQPEHVERFERIVHP